MPHLAVEDKGYSKPMALPAVIHLRCSECASDPDYGDCQTCGGYGSLTLGACQIDGDLLAWHFECEQFMSFDCIDDLRDGWARKTWRFGGTLVDRRVLDLLNVAHGVREDYESRADHYQRRLRLPNGAWMELPSAHKAIQAAKEGRL